MFCLLAFSLHAQKLDWYSLWGSSNEGSHIKPDKMAVDSEDNLYVAARFCGSTVAVEDQTLVSKQGSDLGDAVLVKMAPDKAVVWTRKFSDARTATIIDITVDNRDNIVVAGTFTGTINPDGQRPLEFDDGEYDDCTVNAFVVRFDKEGNVLNLWRIPAFELTSVRVAVDADANVYVAGTYGSYLLIGDAGVGTFGTDNQLFLAKYSPAGELLSLKYTDASNIAYGNASVAVDTNGDIYVTGTFTGSFDFAGKTFSSADSDAFLLKYDATFAEQWAKRIGGTGSNETGIDVVLSPVGDVAIGGIVETSTALTVSDLDSTFAQHYGKDSPIPHVAITTFTKNGDFRWHYWYGYSTGQGSFNRLRCTSEGVYYLSLSSSGRAGDISTGNRGLAGQNSGVWFVDGQHMSHNTNGGNDAILCVVSPDGGLANFLRPGGAQTEHFMDVALTADKRHAYFLLNLIVRANDATIPLDNFWISYTDIKAAGKLGDFTSVKTPCPENGTTYTATYVGIFHSACLLYVTLPEVSPNELPAYAAGTDYSQALSMPNPEGTGVFLPLNIPEEFTFAGDSLTGVLAGSDSKYVSIIASDEKERYSYYSPYSSDTEWDFLTDGISTRGNSRNVRNFILEPEKINGLKGGGLQIAAPRVFYPTIVSDVLQVNTDDRQFTVNVYNMLGARVLTYSNQKTIGVAKLSPGIYLAEIITANNGKTIAERIVVK
jgi:hypothetical protein